MEALILILVAAAMAVLILLVWESRESRRRAEAQWEAQRAEMNQRIEGLDQRFTQNINAVQQSLNTSLASSSQTLQQVSDRLAGIDTAAKRIVDEVGPAISSLQDVLKAPAVRGSFGEFLLEQLLADILPSNHYSLQYAFRSGERVDAIVRLPEGIVPIDSKFPLSNFQRVLAAQSTEEREREARSFVRDVKGHIDNVSKYILPDEGTLPFAMMYIPSESVYYEVMVRDDVCSDRGMLADYARQKNVFPVSPNTFYALLQAVAKGLRGLKVEERAREILDHLARLQGDFQHIRGDFQIMGQHISHAKTKYDEVDKRVSRFGDRLSLPLEGGRAELPADPPQAPSSDDGAGENETPTNRPDIGDH
jgi:DNA recombination protein RmuC